MARGGGGGHGRADRDRDRDRKRRDDDDGTRRGSPPGGMRTSTVTTAPAEAAQAANAGGPDEDDLDAFFSSGHGAVMHYDRSDVEAGEAEAAGG